MKRYSGVDILSLLKTDFNVTIHITYTNQERKTPSAISRFLKAAPRLSPTPSRLHHSPSPCLTHFPTYYDLPLYSKIFFQSMRKTSRNTREASRLGDERGIKRRKRQTLVTGNKRLHENSRALSKKYDDK